MPRFTVTLVQTITEVAVCEVEAATEDAAYSEAVARAQDGELDFEVREFDTLQVEDITCLGD